MAVVGIDVSVRAVDLVKVDDDTNAGEWIHVPCADKRGPFFAARLVAQIMPRGSFWDDVWLVGIEKPYSQNRGTVRALALVTGAVAACLPGRLTVIETAPQEWKRTTVGHASASKETVRAWALREGFGWGGMETQDSFDAYAISRAVRDLNQRGIEAA